MSRNLVFRVGASPRVNVICPACHWRADRKPDEEVQTFGVCIKCQTPMVKRPPAYEAIRCATAQRQLKGER